MCKYEVFTKEQRVYRAELTQSDAAYMSRLHRVAAVIAVEETQLFDRGGAHYYRAGYVDGEPCRYDVVSHEFDRGSVAGYDFHRPHNGFMS